MDLETPIDLLKASSKEEEKCVIERYDGREWQLYFLSHFQSELEAKQRLMRTHGITWSSATNAHVIIEEGMFRIRSLKEGQVSLLRKESNGTMTEYLPGEVSGTRS